MLLTPDKIILRTDCLCAKILPVLNYKIAVATADSFMKQHPDSWLWDEDPLDDFVHQLFSFNGD
ncbi:MAG: hypothetical protein RSC76_07730, partial [Oscillospiraceae bacterium]